MRPKQFQTSRLILRKIQKSDQADIYKGLSHPDVIKYYGVNYASFEETEEQMTWYENLEKSNSGLWWSIRMRADNSFCGAIGYYNLHEEHRKAELGFWLLPEFWGKGLIKESAEKIIDHLLHEKMLHRMEAYVEGENANSEKVLQKLNFQYEGTMKDCEIKNGRYIDLKIFAQILEKGNPS